MSHGDLSQMSMQELFRQEAESQTQVLTSGLLELENDAAAADQLEACMRAAHSLKGAARIVGIHAGVDVAHAMEDCFVAAQRGDIRLGKEHIDLLLRGGDLLLHLGNLPEAEISRPTAESPLAVTTFLTELKGLLDNGEVAEALADADSLPAAGESEVLADHVEPLTAFADARESAERVLRVRAENLNRLLGLTGESLVESRWLKPFSESLLRLKRLHSDTSAALDELRAALTGQVLDECSAAALADLQQRIIASRHLLSERLVELDMFDSRSTNLAQRLYNEALACRMRPFADGIRSFPRMVRDLGHALGKQVRLDIVGKATQVDRDILEKLDAPLGHLLRNAIDHGIESAVERLAASKPAEGVITLEARHSAGMLQIIVTDDGRGIDLDLLRQTVIERNHVNSETAHKLSDAELLAFVFLPGFTLRDTVTEVSGRGVGLDVVQDMVKRVRGTVRVVPQLGHGTRFLMQLPLTLSVVRTLLAEIDGEPYAFPLAYIVRTLMLPREQIELIEGRQHFNFDGRAVGLVNACQLLGGGEPKLAGNELPVIVVSDGGNSYGLVADRFLGERALVVQPLDVRFGKVQDIAAGALMEDGSPVLIVDVEDLVRSVEKLVIAGHLSLVQRSVTTDRKRKRVLVVDDSLTVRELERKLLSHAGYEVEVAVDGMDGWNAARTGHFDLMVSDIDMPRMDGIELVTLIKKDPNLKYLPVMIVSYKDREEDRRRGLEAGADYYLTKGSFHDETLLAAVVDMIGEAEA
ncbi:hybrid sensor histidine kinase/response regulator [Aromatoleum diolicum]|uniref:histidine kinase n=1 Tax=Aromatoleum diolicum TaxID=75796 RepID=A0ABX1QG23_9RHOO|nr:hybrid sensor histidine kinase/response regulator [Aromatoleum diolicum]NMG76935.1 response regulator [Aromatoleum diolicum]